MEKKRYGSSVQDGQAGRKGKPTPDSDIDFSDIPESTSRELHRARRVGRPKKEDAKELIAFRIRPSLLGKIKQKARREGKPYQTWMHDILERSV